VYVWRADREGEYSDADGGMEFTTASNKLRTTTAGSPP